jgi:anti-sigma factor RsiW
VVSNRVTCKKFESNVDAYLDSMLTGADLARAEKHLRSCRSCEQTVTQLQEARVLLTTAVAERVAAVDLSGLWERVEAELEPALPARSPGWAGRLAARARTVWAGMDATWQLKPMRVGAWVAAAAAAALLISYAQPEPQGVQVALHGGSYSRPVRIDSLEVAAGHTVSTWVRPRTKTRVIWVAGGDDSGFSVSHAVQSR